MAPTKHTHAEASISPFAKPADGEAQLAAPPTPLDVLEQVLGWACRNRRDLAVAPWADVARVLRREGVDVGQVIRAHGLKSEGGS